VRPSAVLLAAVALALAGCGGGSDRKRTPREPRWSSPQFPFTFSYPRGFRSNATAVALDPRNALVVRRTSDHELDPDQYLAALKASFVRQGLRPLARTERHAGRDMGVLVIDIPASSPAAGGRGPLHTTSYFFAGGGGTWQLECRASTRRAQVDRACRDGVDSLRFG
jgi:hypothetical protein